MNFLRRILPPKIKDFLRPILNGLKHVTSVTARLVLSLFRVLLGAKLFLAIFQYITKYSDLTFSINNIVFDGSEARPLQRAETILTKEPDTIHWISEYVGEDEVFYDIGANIGVFSLFAAKNKTCRVLAFEPMCTNYDLLNRNIYLNKLSDKIQAFNLAFDDQTRFSTLHLSAFLAGKSGHTFAPEENVVSAFEQGMFGMTIDTFVFDYNQPFPNHIKIDVDGNEPRIISGMKRTLADRRLKSIAVELLPDKRPEDSQTIDTIEKAGFELLRDEAYVNPHAAIFKTARNYFFARKENENA